MTRSHEEPKSIKEQIEAFNRDIHAFEDKQKEGSNSAIGVIKSLDPVGLERYAANLQANLDGIAHAKSLEELDLYKNSFDEVLGLITIDDEAMLGIHLCLVAFRYMIYLSNVSFEADLKKREELESKITARLGMLDIELKEFMEGADHYSSIRNELLSTLKITGLKSDEEQKKIETLEAELKRIEEVKIEMQVMRASAEAMLRAKDRQDYDDKRKVVSEKILHIQRLGGGSETGKNMQNYYTDRARKYTNELYEARASYLPGPSGVARKLANFTWIAVGAAMIAVGLAISAPIAIIGLGIAGIIYGGMDLAKEIAEPIVAHSMPKMGKRVIEKPPLTRGEKIKRVAKKAVPIVLCTLALAAGIAALAFPPTAIAMGVIGFGWALTGVGMMAANWYKERKKSKKMVGEHTKVQNEHKLERSERLTAEGRKKRMQQKPGIDVKPGNRPGMEEGRVENDKQKIDKEKQPGEKIVPQAAELPPVQSSSLPSKNLGSEATIDLGLVSQNIGGQKGDESTLLEKAMESVKNRDTTQYEGDAPPEVLKQGEANKEKVEEINEQKIEHKIADTDSESRDKDDSEGRGKSDSESRDNDDSEGRGKDDSDGKKDDSSEKDKQTFRHP